MRSVPRLHRYRMNPSDDVAKVRLKYEKIVSLATHPRTPVHEATAARRRMAAFETEYPWLVEAAKPPPRPRRAAPSPPPPPPRPRAKPAAKPRARIFPFIVAETMAFGVEATSLEDAWDIAYSAMQSRKISKWAPPNGPLEFDDGLPDEDFVFIAVYNPHNIGPESLRQRVLIQPIDSENVLDLPKSVALKKMPAKSSRAWR